MTEVHGSVLAHNRRPSIQHKSSVQFDKHVARKSYDALMHARVRPHPIVSTRSTVLFFEGFRNVAAANARRALTRPHPARRVSRSQDTPVGWRRSASHLFA